MIHSESLKNEDLTRSGIEVRKFLFEAKSYKKFIKYLIKRESSAKKNHLDSFLDFQELKSHYLMLKKYVAPLNTKSNDKKIFFSDFYLKISKSSVHVDEKGLHYRVINDVSLDVLISKNDKLCFKNILSQLVAVSNSGFTSLSLDDRITISMIKETIDIHRDLYIEKYLSIFRYHSTMQYIVKYQNIQFNSIMDIINSLNTEALQKQKLKSLLQKKISLNSKFHDITEALVHKNIIGPNRRKNRKHSLDPRNIDYGPNKMSMNGQIVSDKNSAMSIQRTTLLFSADNIELTSPIHHLWTVMYESNAIKELKAYLDRWNLDYGHCDRKTLFDVETVIISFQDNQLQSNSKIHTFNFISNFILSSYQIDFAFINEYFYYKLKVLK